MPKHFHCIDKPAPPPNNGGVTFNSVIRFSSLNALADSRLYAAIFMSVRNTIGTSISMAGRGGDTFGYAGSQCAGLLTLPCACHPPFSSGRQVNPALEAIMPKLSRALSRLFPSTAVPVSVLPSEAEARALSALLVAQGRRAVFHRTAAGFAVEVLA